MSADKIEDALMIKKGDIVRLEYSGWTADTNELFDTTDPEVAKEAGLFNENVTYGAIPVLVGGGRLFEGLDEALMSSFVNEEREVTIMPEKAAGPRDPKLVEQIPVREFLKQDIEPRIGIEVTVKNRVGLITGLTPRIVRVDFNRRFAGKSLRYKFKVACKVMDDVEKVIALVQMDYGTGEGFKAKVEEKDVDLTIPDVCKYDQKWLLAKYKVVADLREALGAKTVRFIEEYVKKAEEKLAEEKPAEDKPTEEVAEEVITE